MAVRGAEWIHLVDLDAAFGRGDNRELLSAVVRRLDVKVELSGGIRDDASLAAALATGCTRVNVGTAALESPDWVRAAIAATAIASRWDSTCGVRHWPPAAGRRRAAISGGTGPARRRRLCTLRRHRRQQGRHADRPEPGAAPRSLRQTSAAVVASGGVSSLDNLRAIAALGTVEGAIVGKALYARAFTLPEALAAVGS